MDDKITTIIFDLGNVLIDFDHNIAAEKVLPFTDKGPREIFNLFFDSEITAVFEEGRISPGDFFLKIKQLLGLTLEYNEFLPIWNEIFFLSERNHAVNKLAGVLKNRYKTAILSNINILHFDYINTNFRIFDAFRHIFTSYSLGVRKPDASIYIKTLDILRVAPENVFYTDDRPELIQESRRLGINGFVFQGVEQLKKDLLTFA